MDRILEFTRKSTEISQDFYPPIELDGSRTNVIGLYSLSTFNSLTNVTKDVNDCIIFQRTNILKPPPAAAAALTASSNVPADKNKKEKPPPASAPAAAPAPSNSLLQIPPGSYELADLGKFIEEKAKEFHVRFRLNVNPIMLKVEMWCDHAIEFPPNNSIRGILGFEKEVYAAGLHVSEGIPQITPISTCLLYTSPSPRDRTRSRMPSSA